jgi:putative oxidoreductase
MEDTMRNVALLGARVVLGGYLAAHGAQKLFGAFGGAGLEKVGTGFERHGLTHMAAAAGISELGGGLLTIAGAADPAGPLAIAGTMCIAVATHRTKGPFTSKGGYELPLTNLAAAAALVASGPGKYRVGPSLPGPLAAVGAAAGGVAVAALLTKMLTHKPEVPAPVAASQPGPAAAPSETKPA